jgi:hypothetical protein
MEAPRDNGYDVNYPWSTGKHDARQRGPLAPERMRRLWRGQAVWTDLKDRVERSFREPVKKQGLWR